MLPARCRRVNTRTLTDKRGSNNRKSSSGPLWCCSGSCFKAVEHLNHFFAVHSVAWRRRTLRRVVSKSASQHVLVKVRRSCVYLCVCLCLRVACSTAADDDDDAQKAETKQTQKVKGRGTSMFSKLGSYRQKKARTWSIVLTVIIPTVEVF